MLSVGGFLHITSLAPGAIVFCIYKPKKISELLSWDWAYILMVKRTAHDGPSVGSIPAKPNTVHVSFSWIGFYVVQG